MVNIDLVCDIISNKALLIRRVKECQDDNFIKYLNYFLEIVNESEIIIEKIYYIEKIKEIKYLHLLGVDKNDTKYLADVLFSKYKAEIKRNTLFNPHNL